MIIFKINSRINLKLGIPNHTAPLLARVQHASQTLLFGVVCHHLLVWIVNASVTVQPRVLQHMTFARNVEVTEPPLPHVLTLGFADHSTLPSLTYLCSEGL